MRIKFLTGNKLQIKYLSLIIIAMIIPTLIVGSCLYYFIFTIMAEQLAIPESIAVNLIPVVQKINIMLVIGLIPLFLLLLFWGLVLSHRFAGPLARIEEDLDKVLSGDKSIRLKVRDDDDIKSIVNKLNKLIERV